MRSLFAVIGVIAVAAIAPGAGAAAGWGQLAGKTFVSPGGTEMKVLIDAGVLGGTEVDVVELTLPANSNSGDHKHGATETFYLLEGELEQIINGTSHLLTPGKAVSLRPGDVVVHKAGPKGAKVLAIWAPGGEAGRIASRWKEQ